MSAGTMPSLQLIFDKGEGGEGRGEGGRVGSCTCGVRTVCTETRSSDAYLLGFAEEARRAPAEVLGNLVRINRIGRPHHDPHRYVEAWVRLRSSQCPAWART